MWSTTTAASPPAAPNGAVAPNNGAVAATARTTSIASSSGSVTLAAAPAAVTTTTTTTTSAVPTTASPVVSGSSSAHYASYLAQGGSSGYASYTVPALQQHQQQQQLIPSSSSTLPLPRYTSVDSANAATVLAANYAANYSYLQPVGSGCSGCSGGSRTPVVTSAAYQPAAQTSAGTTSGLGSYLGPPVSYSFQPGQVANSRSGYSYSGFQFDAATPPTSALQGRAPGGLMLPAAAISSDFVVPATSSSGSLTVPAGAAAMRTISATSAASLTLASAATPPPPAQPQLAAASAVAPASAAFSSSVSATAPSSQQTSALEASASSPASTAPASTPINNNSSINSNSNNNNNSRNVAGSPDPPAGATIASASSSFMPPLAPPPDGSSEVEGGTLLSEPIARARRREALCAVAFQFVDIHQTGYLDQGQNMTGLTMVFHQLGDVPIPKDEWFARVFTNFLPPGKDFIDFPKFLEIVKQWDEHHRRKYQAQAGVSSGVSVPGSLPSGCLAGRSLSSEPAREEPSGSGSSSSRGGSGSGSSEEEEGSSDSGTDSSSGEEEGEGDPTKQREGDNEPDAEGKRSEMKAELSRDRSLTGDVPGGNSGTLFGSICRPTEEGSITSSYIEEAAVPPQGTAKIVASGSSAQKGADSPASSVASAPAPPPPPQRPPRKQSSKRELDQQKEKGKEKGGSESLGEADLAAVAAVAAADPASAAAAAIVAPREGELEPEDQGPRSGPAFTASNSSSPPRRPGSGSSTLISRDPSRKSTATRKSNAVELAPDFMHPTKEGRLAIFDDYEFFGDVGAGAFGKVMVVRHRQTKQMRACKNVAVESALQRELIDTEVRLLKSLNHPNIMAMHEVYYEQSGQGRLGNIFLVTELCEGGDLFSRILHHYERLREPISESQSAFMMKQILSATKYCHDLRIVHRDIKPENILFVDRGANSALKIIDFGLANFTLKIKEQAREVKVPKGGTVGKLVRLIPGLKGRHLIPWNDRKVVMQKAGTPHYMAPEMLEGNYDEKADIFSIGIIFCQLLSGWHPFYVPGDDEEAVRAKIASADKVDFPAGIKEAISPDARDLALKLVEKKGRLRITAGQALNHSWFLDPEKPSPYGNQEALSVSIFEGLMQYQAYNKLKKAVLQLLTRELSEFQIQELRNKFLALDKEGDGLLSPEELIQGMRHVGYELNEAELEQLLYSLASPLNQKIGYKEFISALIERRVKFDRQQLQECFNRFDTKGLGLISYEDVQRAISASISESEWHEITTGSGSREGAPRDLNFDEFVALMEYSDGYP